MSYSESKNGILYLLARPILGVCSRSAYRPAIAIKNDARSPVPAAPAAPAAPLPLSGSVAAPPHSVLSPPVRSCSGYAESRNMAEHQLNTTPSETVIQTGRQIVSFCTCL